MYEMQLLISRSKLKAENDKIDIYKFTMAAIEFFVNKYLRKISNLITYEEDIWKNIATNYFLLFDIYN